MKFGEILKMTDYDQLSHRSDEDFLKHAISSSYEFRRNIITGRRQYRRYSPLPSDRLEWIPLTDEAFNSIWSFMRSDVNFKKIGESDLRRIIESDFTFSYDPIGEYFANLPVWDGKTDYIKELALLVKVKPGLEGNWYFYLSRWLIASVATMLGRGINHTCLILLGPQGCGKSTFFHQLGISEELTYTGHIIPGDRDSKIMAAEKTLINLDEIESSTREDWAFIKSLITLPHITVRRPYGRNSEDLPRRASFCGSANKLQLLGDLTGSRRCLCVEVDSINYSGVTDDLKRYVYSQSRDMLEAGCKYWFDEDEIRDIDDSNKNYYEVCHEDEIINELYEPIDFHDNEAVYKTATQIIQEIKDSYPAIFISKAKLSQVLKNRNFQKGIKRGVKGKNPVYCYSVKIK